MFCYLNGTVFKFEATSDHATSRDGGFSKLRGLGERYGDYRERVSLQRRDSRYNKANEAMRAHIIADPVGSQNRRGLGDLEDMSHIMHIAKQIMLQRAPMGHLC